VPAEHGERGLEAGASVGHRPAAPEHREAVGPRQPGKRDPGHAREHPVQAGRDRERQTAGRAESAPLLLLP
jgi:hypothetical protein